jgi:hypothetical protein
MHRRLNEAYQPDFCHDNQPKQGQIFILNKVDEVLWTEVNEALTALGSHLLFMAMD